MQDLPLEIRDIDNVEVHDADRAHAGSSEIQCCRRAEASGAYQEDPGSLELPLAFHSNFREQEVAAVALELVPGQLRQIHGLDRFLI
jgi:hypothetical protein